MTMDRMRETILSFHEQFSYTPKIENGSALLRKRHFIAAGMGGSNLAPGLLLRAIPGIDIVIHRTYGLPLLSREALHERLIVLISYSGNTEETIDAFHTALRHHLALAVITTGGELLELAKTHGVPFVELPKTNIQPRLATGFNLKAMLALMGLAEAQREITELAATLRAHDLEERGKKLAAALKGRVPIIYASEANHGIAYNWKVKMNETAKIPAFMNVFPELNHNEMTGFDVAKETRALSKPFAFLFLKDEHDRHEIIRRMEICKTLYEERGFAVHAIPIRGRTAWHAIMQSILLADWTAYHLSKIYGTEPDAVPMVETFKAMLRKPPHE